MNDELQIDVDQDQNLNSFDESLDIDELDNLDELEIAEKDHLLTLNSTFKQYCLDISKYEVYPKEEEYRLFKIVNDGKTAEAQLKENSNTLSDDTKAKLNTAIQAGLDAKQQLFLHNLRYVVFLTKRYITYVKEMDIMDLIQEGNIGLLLAIDNFDISKGYTLTTYAHDWIIMKVTRAINNYNNEIHVSEHKVVQYRKIKRQIEKEEQLLNRKLTNKEIEDLIKDPDLYKEYILQTKIEGSLNAPISKIDDDPDSEFGDYIEDPRTNTEQIYEKTSMNELVHKLIEENLSDREQDIVKSIYGIGQQKETFQYLAEKYHITRQRVQQILVQSQKKIEKAGQKYDLIDYSSADNRRKYLMKLNQPRQRMYSSIRPIYPQIKESPPTTPKFKKDSPSLNQLSPEELNYNGSKAEMQKVILTSMAHASDLADLWDNLIQTFSIAATNKIIAAIDLK